MSRGSTDAADTSGSSSVVRARDGRAVEATAGDVGTVDMGASWDRRIAQAHGS
jgi:hypothetical protein